MDKSVSNKFYSFVISHPRFKALNQSYFDNNRQIGDDEGYVFILLHRDDLKEYKEFNLDMEYIAMFCEEYLMGLSFFFYPYENGKFRRATQQESDMLKNLEDKYNFSMDLDWDTHPNVTYEDWYEKYEESDRVINQINESVPDDYGGGEPVIISRKKLDAVESGKRYVIELVNSRELNKYEEKDVYLNKVNTYILYHKYKNNYYLGLQLMYYTKSKDNLTYYDQLTYLYEDGNWTEDDNTSFYLDSLISQIENGNSRDWEIIYKKSTDINVSDVMKSINEVRRFKDF